MNFDSVIYTLILSGVLYFGIIRQRISARKMMRTRDQLNFALQSGNMGTWEIDLKDCSVRCSPEMLALWGIDPRHFKNSRAVLQSKVHPEDLIRMKTAIDFAIENKLVYELEYRIFPTPGDERWVLSRGRCVDDLFAGVVYDITESKRREEELSKALKAREQFLTIAGHELKTPLACMTLQLQVNEWDLHHSDPSHITPGRLQQSFKKYRHNLNRLTRIVDNILDEATISEGRLKLQLEHSDISVLTANLIDQVRVLAEKADIELTFSSPQNVYGTWDAFKIEQVILNLIHNSIRYGKKKPVHVEVDQNDTHAIITVKDNGIGIKPADHQRVFSRFERVSEDPSINGIGLGLFISQNIVKSHNGEIQIKSELGKGAEFKVILPKNLEVEKSYTVTQI